MRGDRRPPEAKRRAILEAAARAMAAGGFHGMSMRRLAAEAGLGLSSLYTYFRGKEEILFALQKEAFETLLAHAAEATSSAADAAGRLYAFIAQHVGYFVEHPDVMRVLVHEAGSLPAGRRRQVRRLKERYFACGREILREVVEEGREPVAEGRPVGAAELDRLAYSVFGMLNWIYGWYRPQDHGSPRELTGTIHRIALAGALAEGAPPPPGDDVDLGLPALEAPLPAPAAG